MIIQIAWKNIWRNKVRSLVVILAIAFGLFGGLFTSALMNGMAKQRVELAIKNEISHIQIHNPQYLNNRDVGDTIKGVNKIMSFMRHIPEIKAVSERLKLAAMAATSTTGVGVIVNGVDPGTEKKVTQIYSEIKGNSGSYFDSKHANTVVISQKLAGKIHAKLRSKIVLTLQSVDGSLVNAAFRVCGIYKTINTSFDEVNIYLRKDELSGLIGLEKGKAHEIAILLNNNDCTEAVTNKLKNHFPELDIKNWKEISPDLGIMTDFMTQMLFVIMLILLLAMCFGIINTMLMVVLERIRELGMLMSIGMNKIRIFYMIMLETVFLSLTGGILGIIMGKSAVSLFGKTGLDLSAFIKGFEAVGYSAVIYPSLDWSFYFELAVLVIAIGIIASVYPARKALKLNPAEAIRTI
ncbi:MAG: FtsX-like permease family protein [Bacteroidota bacterium]|nr:FtsX-like permease family protein [Bacteroidota bacterium]